MDTVRLIQATLGGNKTPSMASSEASQVDVVKAPLSTHRSGKFETGFSEFQLHTQRPTELQKPFPTLQTHRVLSKYSTSRKDGILDKRKCTPKSEVEAAVCGMS